MNKELKRLLDSGYFTDGGRLRSKEKAQGRAERLRSRGNYRVRVVGSGTHFFVMIKPKSA